MDVGHQTMPGLRTDLSAIVAMTRASILTKALTVLIKADPAYTAITTSKERLLDVAVIGGLLVPAQLGRNLAVVVSYAKQMSASPICIE